MQPELPTSAHSVFSHLSQETNFNLVNHLLFVGPLGVPGIKCQRLQLTDEFAYRKSCSSTSYGRAEYAQPICKGCLLVCHASEHVKTLREYSLNLVSRRQRRVHHSNCLDLYKTSVDPNTLPHRHIHQIFSSLFCIGLYLVAGSFVRSFVCLPPVLRCL